MQIERSLNNLNQELAGKLNNVKRVFDFGEVLSVKISRPYIQRYYKINRIPYSIFHSKSDLVHMGISRNGAFSEEDLLEAPRFVGTYIANEGGAGTILELGTGRGANSAYLARKFPRAHFWGIDASGDHLKLAVQKARALTNYQPISGDYHDLRRFKKKFFDIVFVIEALFHSANKEVVLKEVFRILRKGGVFVVIEPWLTTGSKHSSSDEKLAIKLTEIGMAGPGTETYDDFLLISKRTGFDVKFEQDVSSSVIPTMKRFEKLAGFFFKLSVIARIIARLLPKEFTYNSISGYLMPTIYRMNLASYFITVLQKK